MDEIHSYGKITVDDFLPWTNLSVERALAVLPSHLRADYGAAWRWFMERDGTQGTRMYGKRIPGVSDNFAISAMRGIHVPAGSSYAVSVTVKRGSIYSTADRPLVPLPNGTWLFEYSEHRNNKGEETSSTWNKALLACLKDGIPVGVFIEMDKGSYLRHLAFVEEYHPDRGVFTLHGPITSSKSYLAAINYDSTLIKSAPEYHGITLAELEEDHRKYAWIRRAKREGQSRFRTKLLEAYEGQCACSGCNVTETLQAAHIIEYRGQESNATENGLLLRADLHLLFDNSLISVDPKSSTIITSSRLNGTNYTHLNGKKLRPPKSKCFAPNTNCLLAHYRKFEQIEHLVGMGSG